MRITTESPEKLTEDRINYQKYWTFGTGNLDEYPFKADLYKPLNPALYIVLNREVACTMSCRKQDRFTQNNSVQPVVSAPRVKVKT